MHHRIQQLSTISPEELDRFLSEGWYRMGQTMITCRFVVWDEQIRGVLWTRTRLAGYQLSRSNRRLMRQNLQRYTVAEGPLVIDDEHEALYARYLEIAPGQRSASLSRSMLGNASEDRFSTREIALRDEDGELVGFSVFDLGNESLQSLMGVYDPNHKAASLGYWTLLLEVEHAISLGLRYHYAGYVIPQTTDMDYKLRVGQMEFLQQDTGLWLPWEDVDTTPSPAERLEGALAELQHALDLHGVPSCIESYRWFEAPAWSPTLAALLAEPRVVVLGADANDPPWLSRSQQVTVVTWSFDTRNYALVLCARVMVSSSSGSDDDAIEMWLVQGRVELDDDAVTAAAAVARWWRMPDRMSPAG